MPKKAILVTIKVRDFWALTAIDGSEFYLLAAGKQIGSIVKL